MIMITFKNNMVTLRFLKNRKKIINQMLTYHYYDKHIINLHKSTYAFYLHYYCDYILT